MDTVANKLVKVLQEKALTIAFAESVTCGIAAHTLSTVKGTMDILRGSLVCYHPSTKIHALSISSQLIQKYTAESQQVTDAMAEKLPHLFDADIFAAITGLSAPGGSETKDKPVGTIFIAVYYKEKLHRLQKLFRGTPVTIKEKACKATYKFVLDVINTDQYSNKRAETK